jgi:hypothetical protein
MYLLIDFKGKKIVHYYFKKKFLLILNLIIIKPLK